MRIKILLFVGALLLSFHSQAQFLRWLGLESKPERPRVSFSFSENELQLGDSVVLSWEVTHSRDSLMLGLNDSVVGPKGSITLWPDTLIHYRLTVETSSGMRTRRNARIGVLKPVMNGFVLPDSVPYGSKRPVKWAFENVEEVYFNQKKVPSRGDTILEFFYDTQIDIRGLNRNGVEVSASGCVPVQYRHSFQFPQAINFGKDTIRIVAGHRARFAWNFNAAQNLVINDTLFLDKEQGSLEFQFFRNTPLVLRAKDHKGEEVVRRIFVLIIPVDINELSITNVVPGENFRPTGKTEYYESIRMYNNYRISWNISGIIETELDGHTFGLSGFLHEQALRSKTHSLTYYYYERDGSYVSKTLDLPLDVSNRPYYHGGKNHISRVGGQDIYMEILSVDYSQFPDAVRLKVIAINRNGDFVTGLAAPTRKKVFRRIIEEFESGSSVIRDFSVREVMDTMPDEPYDILFAMDYSGSMYPYVTVMERLVAAFVKMKHPRDRMALMKFDHRLTGVSPFEHDEDEVLNYLGQHSIRDLGGMTALYACADSALISFPDDSLRKKKLILFTDGYENFSFVYRNILNTSATEVTRRARARNIPVNVVSLGTNVNHFVLDLMSDFTGGHYYDVPDLHALSLALFEISNSFHHYYEIVYTPESAYAGRKTISLVYDDNRGGEGLSTKQATHIDHFGSMDEQDLPPIHDQVKALLDSLGLRMVAPPQNFANFDFADASIRVEDSLGVANLARIMHDEPSYMAILVGHTDLVGTDESCDALSMERAQESIRELMKYDIDENRMIPMGLGRRAPIWQVEREEEQAFENRRSEILFVRRIEI